MKYCLYILLILLAGCQLQEKKDYRIAYNVLYEAGSSNYEIFVMDMDGSNKKNISNRPGVEWVYHSGGDRLYFVSDQDTAYRNYFLYSMDADGRNVQKISDIRLRDSWFSTRKKGQEVIINPHPSVDSVFYVIGADGNKIMEIDPELPYASDPCFSPDGDKIVFRGANFKSKREPGFIDELYLINADGTSLQQLTQYPPNDTTAEWYAYRSGPPRWHPTENFISYQSKQNGKYSLYAVSPDGKKQWKLTSIQQEEGWHDWSSDGRWLAVELFDPGQTAFHIGLLDWQTKNLKILTDTTYTYQQAPVFVEINAP